MCGICGYVGPNASFDAEMLSKMNDTMFHRGPDDAGLANGEGWGLAVRRLSIIDIAGGHQPVTNEDGSVQAILNGEIYNHLELRERLVRLGHTFKTHSDTEVIVHLYEEHDLQCFAALRGMFAIALWDSRLKRCLIARDIFGIKPLFYAKAGGGTLFASEIKALFASSLIRRDVDVQGLDAYLAYGYIPGERTMYRGIRKLAPGSVLSIDCASGETRQTAMSQNDVEVVAARARSEGSLTVEHALLESIRTHMLSDVPVTAFLSGGLDSGLVVSGMAEAVPGRISAFTIGFDDASGMLYDERPAAQELCRRYGVDHHVRSVSYDVPEVLEHVVRAFDEPFGDDSVIPTYYLCREVASSFKVALSGLGGDELFGGYERYRGVLAAQALGPFGGLLKYPARLGYRWLRGRLGGEHFWDRVWRFSESTGTDPARSYLSFVTTVPRDERLRLYAGGIAREIDTDETEALILDPFRSAQTNDAVERAMYADVKTYLPEDVLALTDRLSMAHSLEVRVPFVDVEVAKVAARVARRDKVRWNEQKGVLRSIARRRLPEMVAANPKQGFEAPMAAWLRDGLAAYLRKRVAESARLGDFVSVAAVDRELDEHLRGRRNRSKLLFSVLMLAVWSESYAG